MDKLIENLDLTAKGVWFPIVVGIISLLFMLFMPKRLSWQEIYLTFGVVGFVTLVIDVIVMSTWLDLFDLGSKPHIEGIGDLISLAIIPSCMAVIFLNFLIPEKKGMYVALFTLISFIFEWTLVEAGYMKLEGWNTWWSIPVYLIVYRFWLPWQLDLIRDASGITQKKYSLSNKTDVSKLFRIKEKAK